MNKWMIKVEEPGNDYWLQFKLIQWIIYKEHPLKLKLLNITVKLSSIMSSTQSLSPISQLTQHVVIGIQSA
jgi:hypothetical protein